ncbi:MAG: nickel/cobalt transporter [Chloroflexi bacterium]|nr:nickel/cobalt transporter [Chloroflexota bacterium]MBI3040410.1 nickel/cobalt transporter [Chloroflexota bacterium]MBI3930739.1 nickel/cobalt transporter [Chloroflexota bacterium]
MFNPAYVGVVTLGLLHGFEPGHGWPVAVLYAMKKRNAVASATLSSSIIGIGHLVSSIAVVVAYVLLQRWLNFEAPWLKYIAAALLLILASKLFREKVDDLERQHGHNHEGNSEIKHEHEHEHPGQSLHTHKHKHRAAIVLSLLGLALFAFILGFAHEEEIALLALVAGGLNAWILMLAYGVSVLLGLIVATVAGVKLYKQFQPKLARYEKYIPKISAAILVAMAIIIIFW